jgi:ribokinase
MHPAGLFVVGNSTVDLTGFLATDELTFGSLMEARAPAQICLGGNGALAAAAGAALGAEVRLASAIGDDDWGSWIQGHLIAMGVDTTQVDVHRGTPSANTVAVVQPDGERALITHNGASDLQDLEMVELEGVGPGSWVLIASLGLVRSYADEALWDLAERVKREGASVAMDLTWDPTGEWTVDRLSLQLADLVLGTDREFMSITGTDELGGAFHSFMDQGIRTAVAKLGARGASFVVEGGERIDVPAFSIQASNATGAGDVFNAAMLVALSRGDALADAVTFASGAGALRASKSCDGFPTMEEVEALLESASRVEGL